MEIDDREERVRIATALILGECEDMPSSEFGRLRWLLSKRYAAGHVPMRCPRCGKVWLQAYHWLRDTTHP